MKQGDFSQLAECYVDRPCYGSLMRDSLLKLVEASGDDFVAVDVGAGTGKWTRQLAGACRKVIAIEPCDEMREKGVHYTEEFCNVSWYGARAEATGFENGCASWVTMASSFHWVDPQRALPEFHRILKKNGFLTILYNSRNLEEFPLNREIDEMIGGMLPNLRRVSSGLQNVKDWSRILVSTGSFCDAVFMECDYAEMMTSERYVNIWNSVNDVRAQAGEDLWRIIMQKIREKCLSFKTMSVPYKIRAWTVRRSD